MPCSCTVLDVFFHVTYFLIGRIYITYQISKINPDKFDGKHSNLKY